MSFTVEWHLTTPMHTDRREVISKYQMLSAAGDWERWDDLGSGKDAQK